MSLAIPLEPIVRLSRDLANAAKSLSLQEARFLVDSYYSIQRDRLRSANQIRALVESGEPHDVLIWLANQSQTLEDQIKRALDKWTDGQPVGRWAKNIPGIGPVLSAGLIAYIPLEHDRKWHDVVLLNAQTEREEAVCSFRHEDGAKKFILEAYKSAPSYKLPGQGTIEATSRGVSYPYEILTPIGLPVMVEEGDQFVIRERNERVIVNTAGKVWSFAGMVPGIRWEKGQVRPWNAKLKTLCYKCGESFVKVSGKPDDVYGKLYKRYKEYIAIKNEKGDYAEQAKEILLGKKFGVDTIALGFYQQGKLPPGHIHARARRYAVRIFLSHFHAVAYRLHFGMPPPKPFAISILGHGDMIQIPFFDAYNQDAVFPF